MGKAKNGVRLHVTEWKEDVVYLFQFPRTKHMAQVSPYCLKIESFLKLHEIKYEVHETFKIRSPQGLLPFIELNGRLVSDSSLIIAHLQKHFNIQEYVDESEAAQGRAIARAVDSFTVYTLWKYKVVDHAKDVVAELLTAAKMPGWLRPLVKWNLARKFKSYYTTRVRSQLGIWPDGTHEEFVRDEFRMYEALVKNFENNNLFGSKITSADLALWSHLATILYLPFDNLPKKLLQEEFPHLKSFTERLRQQLWPDFVKDNFVAETSICK